jgi:multiple sugar transport system ATP-binding protein
MNFLPIHSSIQKGCTSVSINGFRLNIPEIQEAGNTDLNYLGVRPENIEIMDTDREGLQGKVYGVEYLGARKIVTIDTAVGRVKVRSANNLVVKLDDNVKLKFNSKRIIIYNSDDGKAIKSEVIT